MRRLDLLAIAALALLQVLLVLLGTGGPLRIAGGLLMMTLWPGYSLLAALGRGFRQALEPLEHVALAIPASLSLNALLGLALNHAGLSVDPLTSTLWMSGYVMLLSAAAAIARQRRKHADRDVGTGAVRGLVLGGIVLVALATGIAITYNSRAGPSPHTSLYLLDQAGTTAAYPAHAAPDAPILITVGIAYKGDAPRDVHLVASSTRLPAGYRARPAPRSLPVVHAAIPITLQPGEIWEAEVAVTLTAPGLHRIRCELCPVDGGPCERAVHLWIRAGSE